LRRSPTHTPRGCASPLELSVPLQTIRSGARSAVPIRWGGQRTTKKRSTSAAPGSETIIASFSSEHVEATAYPFAKLIGNRERICLPDRCSRKRGAPPSRSLCSASRRTEGAADSTHRLVRQGEWCQLVGGTPTGAVETTALPIFNCIVP